MYLLRNIRAAYILLLLYIISYQMQAYSKRHSINLFSSNEFKINWRYFRFQMNNMCRIMRWRVVVHSDNTNIWNIFKWWSTASMTKWTASLSIYYIVKNQNEFACAKAKTKRRNFQSQWQWNLTFDNLYLRIWVFNFYFCWGHWYETWSHFNRYVCVCVIWDSIRMILNEMMITSVLTIYWCLPAMIERPSERLTRKFNFNEFELPHYERARERRRREKLAKNTRNW